MQDIIKLPITITNILKSYNISEKYLPIIYKEISYDFKALEEKLNINDLKNQMNMKHYMISLKKFIRARWWH